MWYSLGSQCKMCSSFCSPALLLFFLVLLPTSFSKIKFQLKFVFFFFLSRRKCSTNNVCFHIRFIAFSFPFLSFENNSENNKIISELLYHRIPERFSRHQHGISVVKAHTFVLRNILAVKSRARRKGCIHKL